MTQQWLPVRNLHLSGRRRKDVLFVLVISRADSETNSRK
jgi:hypothetical protein